MRKQHPFRVVQIQGDKVIGVSPLFNPFFAFGLPRNLFPESLDVGKLFLIEAEFGDTGQVDNAIILSKL